MSMAIGFGVGLPWASRTVAPAPGATSALYLPYDGLRIVEGAGAGAVVATMPFGSNTTRSITGVTNAAGSTVTNVFSIVGGNLVAGSTASLASDTYYNVTIHEVGSNTTDTTVPIYVVPKGVAPTVFTDAFSGTNGDLLVPTHGGWTLPTGNSSAALTINGSNQLATAIVGSGAVSTNFAVVNTGTLNHYAKVQFPSAPVANTTGLFVRATDGNNYVRILVSLADAAGPNGPVITPIKRVNGSATTSVFGGVNAGGGYFCPTSTHSAGNLQLEARVIDDRLFIYACQIGGTPTLLNGYPGTGLDIADVFPTGNVGIGASTAAGTVDNFECGQVGQGASQTGAFSQVPTVVPVYAVDPVALKAQIPISMAFTSAAPTALEFRIEDSAGAAVSGYDWAIAANAIIGTSGFALTAIAPVGTGVTSTFGTGLWRVAVRDKNNTSVSGKTALFGVGDVIALTGQSNAQRLMNTYASAVDSYTGASWVADANASPQFIRKGPTLLQIAGANNTIIGLTGRPAWILNLAASGQPASYFRPSNAYWTGTLLPFIRAQQLRFTGQFHIQGETDVISNTQSTWVQYSQEFFEALWAATSQSAQLAPISVGMIAGESGLDTFAGAAIVTRYLAQRKLEAQLVALYANASFSHHHWDMDGNPSDYIHIKDVDMYGKHAPRFAFGLAKKLGFSAVDHAGPLVTIVSRSGAVLTVTVNLNGATSLGDTTATKAGALTAGWQVVAAAGYNGSQNPDSYFTTAVLAPPLSIASVIYSGTTITVTLSSDPGGPVALRYMAGVSGGTPVYDGAMPFGANYNSGSGPAASAQIVGNYSDGSQSGVMPMISALAAV